jgi:hypothetical protein
MSRPRREGPRYDPEKTAQIEKELGMAPALEYVEDVYHMAGSARLYRFDSRYFLLSTAHIPQLLDSGPGGPWESYAFRCDSMGKVTDWAEVAGARGTDMYMTRSEALVRLEGYVTGEGRYRA